MRLTLTHRSLLGMLLLGISAAPSMSQETETCLDTMDVPPLVEPPSFFTTSAKIKDVFGCCSENSEQEYKETVIGKMPQFTTEQSLEVVEQAKLAWNNGNGVWPQMSMAERIETVEKFLVELQKERAAIVHVLMWEIGKNFPDAASEFDRTIEFARKVINVLRTDPEYSPSWQAIGSTRALVRRAAIGIILCLGPYNYPLNETYAALIPALLLGNIVILKIPTIGGLAHFLTMEAFKVFPEGTIQFLSGSGRSTMPPVMASGDIDGLAFIGGSNAADDLISKHPHPHRLKVFLQLEANNMALYLSDLFGKGSSDALQNALDQAVIGSLSFNGQRCTALKLHFVPKQYGMVFTKQLVERIEALRVGLPWSEENGKYPNITPLPNQKRIQYMKELIDDALEKGAKIMNKNGGTLVGGDDSTLMVPAVLYPVTSDMKVYHEEQFGPVIPIAEYSDIETPLEFGQSGPYGQQVSIFTSSDVSTAANVIDRYSTVFGKINLNAQCGRSPDVLPFSGRRSSAMGVMSVTYALKEFSTPTVVSYKDSLAANGPLVEEIEKTSKFLAPVSTTEAATD